MRVPVDPTPPIARKAMVVVRVVTVGALIVCLGLVAALLLGIGQSYESLFDVGWLPWSDAPLPPMPGPAAPYDVPPHDAESGRWTWYSEIYDWLDGLIYASIVALGLATLYLERERETRTEPLTMIAAVLVVAAAYWSNRVARDAAVDHMWPVPPYIALRSAPAALRPAVIAYGGAAVLASIGLVRIIRSRSFRGWTLACGAMGSATWSLCMIVIVFFAKHHVDPGAGRDVQHLASAVNAMPASNTFQKGVRMTIETDLSVTLELLPDLYADPGERWRTVWSGAVDDPSLGGALSEAMEDPLARFSYDPPGPPGIVLAISAEAVLGDIEPALAALLHEGIGVVFAESAPRAPGGLRHQLVRTYMTRSPNSPGEGTEVHSMWMTAPPATREASPVTLDDRRFAHFGAAYESLDVPDDVQTWIELRAHPGVPWRSIVHARDRARTVLTLVL